MSGLLESQAGGEFFVQKERVDGTRDLIFGDIGSSDHGHAVLDRNGNPKFIREKDGRIIADERLSQ